MTESTSCYLVIAHGDRAAHELALAQHRSLSAWLVERGYQYGLPQTLTDLDAEGRETLSNLLATDVPKLSLPSSSIDLPAPITLPHLQLSIRTSPGLAKTSKNFLALLTNSLNLSSKRPPFSKLHYERCKVHRIDEGFVVQMGDVTRGDGSGGESIYGGTFKDEAEGLKIPFERGTLGMANGGKNTNTSQFFITLASDPTKLKKLTGKYVAFGRVDIDDAGSIECLEVLERLGDGKGGTREPVWIEECGLSQ